MNASITRESRAGHARSVPVAADAVIARGRMVVIAATGFADQATKAANLTAIGLADESIDNTGGADGAKSVRVERRIFVLKNDGVSPVTRAHIGQDCFIEDDETVTSDNTATSVAGRVFDVDDRGVSVEFL